MLYITAGICDSIANRFLNAAPTVLHLNRMTGYKENLSPGGATPFIEIYPFRTGGDITAPHLSQVRLSSEA